MYKVFFSLILILHFSSCKTGKHLTPTQADADRVKDKFPEISVAELKKGKEQYETYCNFCHDLTKPESHTAKQWIRIVPPMVKAVNNKLEKKALTNKDTDLIIQYLVTMCTIITEKD